MRGITKFVYRVGFLAIWGFTLLLIVYEFLGLKALVVPYSAMLSLVDSIYTIAEHRHASALAIDENLSNLATRFSGYIGIGSVATVAKIVISAVIAFVIHLIWYALLRKGMLGSKKTSRRSTRSTFGESGVLDWDPDRQATLETLLKKNWNPDSQATRMTSELAHALEARRRALGPWDYFCRVCPDGRVEKQLDEETIDSVIQTQGIEYLKDKIEHLADEITCPVCGAKGLVMENPDL